MRIGDQFTVHRAQYFLRSALGGLRASPVTSVVSVVTIAMALLLIGVFLLLLENMDHVLDRFGDSLVVTVYLENDVSAAEVESFRTRFASIEDVVGTVFISKEEALNRFRNRVGDQGGLLDGLDENPLPASFELSLEQESSSIESMALVAQSIDGIPGVDEVSYAQEWVRGYESFLSLARVIGLALGGVLAFAALLIVANTIQLTIYARRDELDILALVGASRTFAGVPFLLEGLLQGVAGGISAVALLYVLYELLLPYTVAGWSFLLGNVPPQFLSDAGTLLIVAVAAGLGLLGSAVALTTAKRP
jgi:cell division transport system permease protein